MGAENQFEHVLFPLPSSIYDYTAGRFVCHSPRDRAALRKFSAAKSIFNNPRTIQCVRTLRVVGINPEYVTQDVFNAFTDLLINACRLQQIWISLSYDISAAVLQKLPRLKALRVKAAALPRLLDLPIQTLAVDCDNDGSHFTIPQLSQLRSLCIIGPISAANPPRPLLEGSALQNLQILSFRGGFGAIGLGGSWQKLRALNLVGSFTSISWLSNLARRLKQLVLSLDPSRSLEHELAAISFPELKILEIHWCRFAKFPRETDLPLLKYYSESRELSEHEDWDLLKYVQPHLSKIKVLALRGQYYFGQGKSHVIQDSYEKLQEVRAQGLLQRCLVQAPTTPPKKTSSWFNLVDQCSLSNRITFHDQDPYDRALEQHQKRLSLLYQVDPKKRFLESKGEIYCFPNAPDPPFNSYISDIAGSSIFPFANDPNWVEEGLHRKEGY